MRTCLVAFLSILFIPLLFLTILFYNFEKTFLVPDFYKKALSESNAYEKLLKTDPKIIYDSLKESAEKEKERGEGPFKSPQDIAEVMEAIPPEALKTTIEKNIDNFFVKVAKKGEKLFVLNLVDLKRGILEKKPSQRITQLTNLVPDTYPIPSMLLPPIQVFTLMPILTRVFFGISLLFLFLIILLKAGGRGKLRLPALLFLIVAFPLFLIFLVGKLVPLSLTSFVPALDFLTVLRDNYFDRLLIEIEVLAILAVVLFLISFLISNEGRIKVPESS